MQPIAFKETMVIVCLVCLYYSIFEFINLSEGTALSFLVCVAMLCEDVGVLLGLKLLPRVDVPTGSSISVAESRNEGRPSENLARI